jgi:hypothetical protein
MLVCGYQALINEVLAEHRTIGATEFFVEMDSRVHTTGRGLYTVAA